MTRSFHSPFASSLVALLFFVAVSPWSVPRAGALPPALIGYDPSAQIRFVTSAQADAKRQELISFIWTNGLPTNTLPAVTTNIDAAVFSGDLAGLNSVLVATVDRLDANVSGFDFHSIAYLIHPRLTNANSARLVIAHQGHQGGLIDGVGDTANRLLQSGFTVLAMQMPLVGWNTDNSFVLPGGATVTTRYGTAGHDSMFLKLVPPVLPGGAVFRFFLEPVVQGINYFLSTTPAADDVSMYGLSGGGWSTHMAPAVDTRIKQSFPVAGAYPLYLAPYASGFPDTEQIYDPLYRETDANTNGVLDTAAGVASWLEIFALGGYGPGRRQTQILNLYDTCCFGTDAFTTYTNFVSTVVSNLGQGEWRFYSDTSHKSHSVSSAARELVILPALSVATSFEAESAVVAPPALLTPGTDTITNNNAYENYTLWTEDSGSSLIVNRADTISAAAAPHLRFTNLTAGCSYQVSVAVAYSPQNISSGFTWSYSYTSATDSVSGAALSFGNGDLVVGTPNASYSGTILTYRLANAIADNSGTIDLYLGNLSTTAGLSGGIDYLTLVPLFPPALGTITVPNASFELPIVSGDGSNNGSPVSGWTHVAAGIVNSGSAQFTSTDGLPGTLPGTADGQQFCGTGTGSGPGFGLAGKVYRGIGLSYATNTIYTLTVAAGKRKDLVLPASGTIELRAASATGRLLGSLDVITGARSGTAFNAENSGLPPSNAFADFSFSVSTEDSPLILGSEVFLVFQSPAGGQIAWDNVRLNAVPKPALRINALQRATNGALTLTWVSQPGRVYAVQASLNLTGWTNVAANVPGGAGNSTSQVIPAGSNPDPAMHNWYFVRVRDDGPAPGP